MIIYKYLWGTEIGKTKLPLSQKRRIWLAFNEEVPIFLKMAVPSPVINNVPN